MRHLLCGMPSEFRACHLTVVNWRHFAAALHWTLLMTNVIGIGLAFLFFVAVLVAGYIGYERRAFLAALALFLALGLVLYLAGGITTHRLGPTPRGAEQHVATADPSAGTSSAQPTSKPQAAWPFRHLL
jgi:hypothetical protein